MFWFLVGAFFIAFALFVLLMFTVVYFMLFGVFRQKDETSSYLQYFDEDE